MNGNTEGELASPGTAERSELDALAARGGQCGVRARIVLALGCGATPARIVKTMGVTYATRRSK